MILTELTVDPATLASRTGWVAKPEGLCKGGMCVPMPAGALEATTLSERLGMPLLHDEEHGLWALGPATVSGKALDTAEVPEVTLPDLDGNLVSLASFRGKKKVVAFAWASW